MIENVEADAKKKQVCSERCDLVKSESETKQIEKPELTAQNHWEKVASGADPDSISDISVDQLCSQSDENVAISDSSSLIVEDHSYEIKVGVAAEYEK